MELDHGNYGKKRPNTKTEAAKAWMERYFNLIGDKMPDKNQIHLPCWETQKDIYQRFCNDIGFRKEETLGISMFYKIWVETFSNVVIPEVGSLHAVICNCILYFCTYMFMLFKARCIKLTGTLKTRLVAISICGIFC